MIDLDGAGLAFSFPPLQARLDALLEAHIAHGRQALLAEPRDAAFGRLMTRYIYSQAPQDWRDRALVALRALTDAHIAEAFAQAVRGHWSATVPPLEVGFQRTLRIPDDGKDHPLPPGLGSFPLKHLDACTGAIPENWKARGGVVLPMYQGEALWVSFHGGYICALKLGAGGINAISGEPWRRGLSRQPQDYCVIPGQSWLDGFCVGKGVIRQFVAMPLGEGYTAEEQVTGRARVGGVQLRVFPMRIELFFTKVVEPVLPRSLEELLPSLLPPVPMPMPSYGVTTGAMPMMAPCAAAPPGGGGAMGLGAGGKIRQEIYTDTKQLGDYDLEAGVGCFVHVVNSQRWRALTGTDPPQPPVTAQTYAQHRLPWFDYYRDDGAAAVGGSGVLAKLKSVFQVAREKQSSVFAEDASLPDVPVVHLGPGDRPGSVRGWRGDPG